jgi:hypothetical protein
MLATENLVLIRRDTPFVVDVLGADVSRKDVSSSVCPSSGKNVVVVGALPASTKFTAVLRPAGAPEERAAFETKEGMFEDEDVNASFVSQFVLQIATMYPAAFVAQIVVPAPMDCLIVPCNIRDLPLALIALFFRRALFTLPSSGNDGMMLLPNGKTRFCIDLRREISWTGGPSNRKVRRCAAVAKLVLDRDVCDTMRRAAAYHVAQNEATWLTSGFIDRMGEYMKETAGSADADTPRLHAFELVHRETGEVLAATLGFSCGRIFHDFTMCTLSRSAMSYGTAVTKLVGEALSRCGFQLWYWGNLLGYMQGYVGKLGGVDLPRPEFYALWDELCAQQPTLDLAEHLASA